MKTHLVAAGRRESGEPGRDQSAEQARVGGVGQPQSAIDRERSEPGSAEQPRRETANVAHRRCDVSKLGSGSIRVEDPGARPCRGSPEGALRVRAPDRRKLTGQAQPRPPAPVQCELPSPAWLRGETETQAHGNAGQQHDSQAEGRSPTPDGHFTAPPDRSACACQCSCRPCRPPSPGSTRLAHAGSPPEPPANRR